MTEVIIRSIDGSTWEDALVEVVDSATGTLHLDAVGVVHRGERLVLQNGGAAYFIEIVQVHQNTAAFTLIGPAPSDSFGSYQPVL